MKRFLKLSLVLLVLFLALPVSNLVLGLPENTLAAEPTGDEVFDRALAVLGRKCANCHTDSPKLPFYASLPIASSIVEADIEKGSRFLDLKVELFPADGGPVSEVALAKTEWALAEGHMPPLKYLMLHWNGGVGSEESGTVLDWIHAQRLQYYATDLATDALALEPVRPIATPGDLDPLKIALGDRLFHDKRLSGDDTISCASCHDLAKGGTDQRRFSIGVGGAEGDINSPTVFNSGYQIRQFWDGRAADLAEQADGPVNNPVEMASNWEQVISKLSQDEELVREFTAVYPDGLKKEHFLDAIATFEETLVTPNSRLDRYLAGEAVALSDAEKAGYGLFKSTGCANCHVGEALGGASFEEMGRSEPYFGEETLGRDLGRFNATGIETDRFRFKVPTLRNVALTYPWFHDGSVTDLSEAVTVMARCQMGRALSEDEVARIVDLLNALTGEFRGELLR